MAEEMILESDEAEGWESDEALVEAEESGESEESEESEEDIGERRPPRKWGKRYYQKGRGVQGIALRGADGRVRNIPFPTKLATAAETNRGLAKQEIGRRTLAGQLVRLETRSRVQQKNDSSVSGLVYLVIGGGLSVWGAIDAARQSTGSKFGNWASKDLTRIATLASVTQLTTSGAKLAINRRYHRSGFGIAADVFAAAQLATFAFASLYTPDVLLEVDTTDLKVIGTLPNGTRVFDKNNIYVVVETNMGKHFMPA